MQGKPSAIVSDFENYYTNKDSLPSNLTLSTRASYVYNSGGHITSAIDEGLNQKLNYAWTNKRVTKMAQYGKENGSYVVGDQMGFSYGTQYTRERGTGNDEVYGNSNDILTRYIFDVYGRCVSCYTTSIDGTEIYGAAVGNYAEQENVKNNLKNKLVIGGSSVNYLLNGDFEQISEDYLYHDHWGGVGITDAGESHAWKEEGCYNPCLYASHNWGDAMLSQTVTLTPGKYTFSFEYAVSYSEFIWGEVNISSTSGTSLNHTEIISLNEGDHAFSGAEFYKSLFTTTFTVPENIPTGSGNVKITIKLHSDEEASSGGFNIDNAMLAKGIGTADFSYVHCGSFDSSYGSNLSTYWSTDSTTSAGSIFCTDSTYGDVAKLVGDLDSEKYIKQRVFEVPDKFLGTSMGQAKSDLNFTVSAFAYAEKALINNTATFRIRADVLYYQGEGLEDAVVSHYFDFDPDCSTLQFVAGNFGTKYDKPATDNKDYSKVRAIDIYLEYSYQVGGYAIFDNVGVTMSDGGELEEYEYYENGLLRSRDNSVCKEYYSYDSDRNLNKVANDAGQITYYSYNNKKSVTSASYYTFTHNGSTKYPEEYGDSSGGFVKTPVNKTLYTYDNNGLVTSVTTQLIEMSQGVESVVEKTAQHFGYETTAGSKIFGALLWATDENSVTIKYFYDENNGRLIATVNTESNTGMYYEYNEKGELKDVKPATYSETSGYIVTDNAERVTYTYDANNLLSEIATDSTVYSFSYDPYGNSSEIKVGTASLATYEYYPNNGNLKKINYGNGFSEEYVYNYLEMLSEIWYNYANGTRE